MTLPNFERMLRLAEESFATGNDPAQLSVTPEEMEKLRRIHPATLSDFSTDDGPIVWVLVIPTTSELMRRFLAGGIDEPALLGLTPVPGTYDCLYLCSALVLPEFRRRGLALKVALGAIEAIRRDHPIGTLFYWRFTGEGEGLARSLARETGLPLLNRQA